VPARQYLAACKEKLSEVHRGAADYNGLMAEPRLRKVRSFVRRPGRTTAAQSRALADLMPRFGIPFAEKTLDLIEVFGRDAPRVLEIGFGNGEALFTLAANQPAVDYLGVEVHEPGIGHLLLLLERAGLSNVRVIDRDAVEVLREMIPDACFDAVNVFFPDPWPKKRHHKRRLIQPEFVRELARVLKPAGVVHIATDWPDYAEHIAAVLHAEAEFRPISPGSLATNPLAGRPPTKFERRGQSLGHEVRDLYYLKSGPGRSAP
jgi:tRNA (guanine-N7-)-methyltransferase